jgi:hypothetical protein
MRWTATGGTIDSVGNYVAGNVPGNYTVVVSTWGGLSDTASVVIARAGTPTPPTDPGPTDPGPTDPGPTDPAPVAQLVLSPSKVSMNTGASQQFAAEGKTSTGSSVAVTPTYTATGGTISSSGRYTAPGTPGNYRVVATDPASRKADTATVTVTEDKPVLAQVILSPTTASLLTGLTRQFTATGKATDGTTISINPAFSATGGSISSSGMYTAGTTPGTYRVIAADDGKADTAVVTISSPQSAPTLNQVILSPTTSSLSVGGTKQFSASGRRSDGSSMSVTPTYSATGGTISSSGMYQAGKSAGKYHVIATASGKSDTAVVTIVDSVEAVTVSPSSASLTVGDTKQLTVAIKDPLGTVLSGQTVSWSSSNTSVAKVSSSGLVTALAKGSATITASSGGKQDQSAISVADDTPTTPPTTPPSSPPPSGSISGCPSSGYDRLVNVSSSSQLSSALANARAGDQIQLAPGTYSGARLSTDGVTVCGPESAFVKGGFGVLSVNDVTFQGFSADGFQPFNFFGGKRNRLRGLTISNVGQEAIHLRCGSSDNVVEGVTVHHTGRSTEKYGEAVYIGSDPSNVQSMCGTSSDASLRNKVIDSHFGPYVTGEDIDVKPGADGTVISGNTSDGNGKAFIAGFAESFYTIRASNVSVTGNRADGGPKNGFWSFGGSGVTYHDNVLDVPGMAFRVDPGTLVSCDNRVTGGSFGNVSCR